MTVAFKADLPTGQKFVLVALCDSANDQGECYPSVTALMAKCSMSDRGVQKALAELEDRKCLRREFRRGRSTVYWVTPEHCSPRTAFTPNVVHHTPERGSPPPPNSVHHTPEQRSPITINEPSIEPSGKQKKGATKPDVVFASVLVEAGFDEETAVEFIAHKTAFKAPLTARAWADHVREAAKAGWTPKEAAEKVMAKSWKGFEAKYVEGEKAGGRGGGSKQSALEARNRAVMDDIFAGGI
jgi:hypothetical protein